MAGVSVWRRPARVWLRIVAGLVAFPAFGVVIALISGQAFGQIPNWLLIASTAAGALVSFLLARKSSLPVAGALIALPLLAYAFTYYEIRSLQQEPSEEATRLPPSMAEPSGRGGGPDYEAQVPPKSGSAFPPPVEDAPPPPVEAVPPPPVEAGGGPNLGTQGEMAAPQPRPAPSTADGGTHYEEWVPPASQPAPPPAAADGTSQQDSAELPEFPWPPPRASASYVLPGRLLASYDTVGKVAGAIIGALEESGYVERSFFQTKAGGVALVTRLERINDDGTSSAEAERWPSGGQYYASSESLLQFLRGLFYVDPGHYRVIVFVLQDMPFSQSSTSVTAEDARAWLTSGANVLPPDIAARLFGGANGGHCTALIYEFASDGTKVHVVESHLTGKEHLEKSGRLAGLGPTH